MQWLYNRFVEIFIYSSIWAAAGIASLTLEFEILVDLPIDWRPVFFCFWVALIPYNLDRIFDSFVQTIPDPKAQSYFQKPWVFILLITSIIATTKMLYQAPTQVVYVSFVGIVPLLYGTPFLPWIGKGELNFYRLKDIPGIKAWIVGGVITYAIVAIPLAYRESSINLKVIFATLFIFVFVVTNSHTFDLRDLKSDEAKGVKTLPLIVGVRNMKVILSVLNLLMLILHIGAWIGDLLPLQIEVILGAIATLIYLWRIQPSSPRPVYSILIDGVLFLPLLSHYFWQLRIIICSFLV